MLEVQTQMLDGLEMTQAKDFEMDDESAHLDIYVEPLLMTMTECSFSRVLAYYNKNYVNEYMQEVQKTTSGANPALHWSDEERVKQRLTGVFEAFIKAHGLLTMDCLNAQLDHVCWEHRRKPWQVLNSGVVGPLFRGLMTMSFVVDTTVGVGSGIEVEFGGDFAPKWLQLLGRFWA